MKKLFLFLILFVAIAALSFGEGFSGETYAEAGYDMDDSAFTYEVDAGAVYNIGWFTVGLDVFTDSFLSYDLGLPLTAVFGGLTLKVEPGLDALFGDEVFVVDGDVTYAAGIFSATLGAGYGTDNVLDITGKVTVTPADWIAVHVEYLDGDDITAGTIGDLELGCTLTY